MISSPNHLAVDAPIDPVRLAEERPRGAAPRHDRYDVIVIGARAAGAATAMLLARRGLSVLAVDRSAKGSDTLSTHSLGRAGVLQLSRWGLLDRIREAGTPITTTVEFRYGGEPRVVDVSAPGAAVDGLYSPRRTVLDPILVDGAVESGAEVCHGVTVAGPTFDGGGRVDGIEIEHGDGGRRRLSARWFVGADGVQSGFARRVGAEITHQDTHAAAILYGYWSGLRDDVMVNAYDVPGRAVGIIPTNGGQACVWVGLQPNVFRTEARHQPRVAYHRALASHPGVGELLANAICDGGYRTFPGMAGFRRTPFGNGWALVGDAGYFKDPVSAHGITDAFVHADLLAEALADVIERGIDPVLALGGYERDRAALADTLTPPVARLASLTLDGDGARAAFKEYSAAVKQEFAFVEARAAARV